MNINGLASIPTTDFLEVIQICDSTFPIGTFNHSFGMENYLREDTITNAKEFEIWQDTFLKTQYKYGEAFVICLVYKSLEAGELDKVWEYDQILTMSSQASETRNGTKMIAKQMLNLIQKLCPLDHLATYQKRIRAGQSFGNPGIVFALYAYHKRLSAQEAMMLYGYSIISTMVQNAVRAIPLGQIAGQEIVKNTFPILEEIYQDIKDRDELLLGANTPGIELSQVKHETQIFRLFMS
ncbi:urease accessory protein UreF [Streptococcus saliviloxodontae]|uniref:Urease accessory protein UreF n=1 Tax=Streptococcus saliviloxodontae TaxID=1349416 RepID=A0ABS2PJ74_9STRE|nr:urease accessory protein UreF [Streptococcus saliviloxodontae]MBM7635327.1 urease accessory protein [Streptococcus saliviloxodontae]